MSPTIRWGLLIGLILTVISLGVNLAMRPMLVPLLADPTSAAATSMVWPLMGISCVTLLVSLALYCLAGNRAAAETGRRGQGVLAGLIAAAISGVIGLLIEIVYPMPNPQMAGGGGMVTNLIGLASGLLIAAVASGAGGWWATRGQI